ncbi:GGDEF domain-containing response regulator [Haliangium ochraceum]|uniref:diguanylate cyclase n=1 Tax=Haliangium ochraceum (strain DSM 14365 / JCM 11303 / SMP-2) TaxID=502025 RepID=D0LJH6_HALO1|nr:diguanylate cyclase [Haliangium ochraceum]ACY16550.1 response regulator receiver modulated diguanylate cyclase [Haliangium ochraceum DSM 14365]
MTAERRETILCVDNDEQVLGALEQQLGERFGDECEIRTAGSGEAALDAIRGSERRLAVLVVDAELPGMSGIELLAQVHGEAPQASKMLLTETRDPALLTEAINRAQLNYYLAKPWQPAQLVLEVGNLLSLHRLSLENQRLLDDLSLKNATLLEMNRTLEAKVEARTRELAAANERLRSLAETDGLTGIYNHRHLQWFLRREVERARRSGLPISVLMIDVDHFKRFNDHHGHPAGDDLLRALATLLDGDRRTSDLCARYGGEEFALVLPDTAKTTATRVAVRLRRRVAEHAFEGADTSQPQGYLSISLGVASFPEDAGDADGLLEAADEALYQAKRLGRDRVALYEGEPRGAGVPEDGSAG